MSTEDHDAEDTVETPGLSQDQVKELIRLELGAKSTPEPEQSVRLESKGLQKQVEVLTDVDRCFVQIQAAFSTELGTIEGDLVEAASVKGRRIIKDRLKLLKIADAGGWTAVEKYEGATTIGDDPTDSKKIHKCIKEARAEKQDQRKTWKMRFNRPQPYAQSNFFPYSGFQKTQLAPRFISQRGPRFGAVGSFAPKMETGQKQIGYNQCLSCLQTGHWSRDCPFKEGPTESSTAN